MISQACYVLLCFPYILFITWNVLHCFKIFGLFSGQICGAFLKCLNRIGLIHPWNTSFMFCYSTQWPLNTLCWASYMFLPCFKEYELLKTLPNFCLSLDDPFASVPVTYWGSIDVIWVTSLAQPVLGTEEQFSMWWVFFTDSRRGLFGLLHFISVLWASGMYSSWVSSSQN